MDLWFILSYFAMVQKRMEARKKTQGSKKNKQIPAFGRLLNAIHQPTTNCMTLWSCQSPCVFSDLTASAVLFARNSDHPKRPNEKWEDISTRTQGLLVYIRLGLWKLLVLQNPKGATSYSIGRPGTLPPRKPVQYEAGLLTQVKNLPLPLTGAKTW